MKASIDLNCDLGEYDSPIQGVHDAAIMAYISSCNIACGAHAGNQQVIDHTIALAVSNHVNIGAHPSYPDRKNFGRQVMQLHGKELRHILRDQIVRVDNSAQKHDAVLAHVKPHGALYNQAAIDLDLAILLAETIAEVRENLMFYGLAHSAMEQAAKEVGLVFVPEGFADRAYTASRTLQPRGETGAIINDAGVMLGRILELIQTNYIATVTGERVVLDVDTICLHSDHEGSLLTAKTLHEGLSNAGLEIKAPDGLGVSKSKE